MGGHLESPTAGQGPGGAVLLEFQGSVKGMILSMQYHLGRIRSKLKTPPTRIENAEQLEAKGKDKGSKGKGKLHGGGNDVSGAVHIRGANVDAGAGSSRGKGKHKDGGKDQHVVQRSKGKGDSYKAEYYEVPYSKG